MSACAQPFFETVVVGCFVRVGIGSIGVGANAIPTYRVAEIISVKDGFRQYAIEKATTTKRVELAIGASKRYFQINFVSNGDFEQAELQKYERMMSHAALRIKPLSFIDDKIKALLAAKNHVYTEGEMSQIVKNNQGTRKQKGNLALQKITLTRELEAAKEVKEQRRQALLKAREEEGDVEGAESLFEGAVEAVEKLAERVKELDSKQELEKKIEQKREGSSFRINDINNRNREFQRSVEEKAGTATLREEVEISAGRATVSDPFKRLPIRPVIYWDVKQSAKKEAEEAAAAEAAAAEAAAAEAAAAEAAASEGLSVSTDAAATDPADGESIISPGFTQLLATPRAADGSEAVGGATEGGMPKLEGKRAQAHDLELDIDISIAVDPLKDAAAPAMPRRLLSGNSSARPFPSADGGKGAEGARLSLKDYMRRARGEE